MISETKIDGTFPHCQFLIKGFNNRIDRDSNDGGIQSYTRGDISTNLIAIESKPI